MLRRPQVAEKVQTFNNLNLLAETLKLYDIGFNEYNLNDNPSKWYSL